jgi:hypothetical protein
VTSLAETVLGLVDLDRKVKSAGGAVSQARRWSVRYPERFPPAEIARRERELAALQERLNLAKEVLAA